MEMNLPYLQGTLYRYPDFPSQYIHPRPVELWLPPGYQPGGQERYPVLYMHDGHNLFDLSTSGYNQVWAMDKAVTRLVEAGKIPPVIIAAAWCSLQFRYQEYMPQKPLDRPENAARRTHYIQQYGSPPFSDRYLKFLVEELKPFVDGNFRTLPGRETTFVMGSSMGGLASLYALVEYPQVFKGAGCVSTHWIIGEEPLVDGLADLLPVAGEHRIYFDYGTAGVDSLYEPYQRRMDEHMAARGFTRGQDWVTQKFEGADHNETAWQVRVEIPLEFLLSPLA